MQELKVLYDRELTEEEIDRINDALPNDYEFSEINDIDNGRAETQVSKGVKMKDIDANKIEIGKKLEKWAHLLEEIKKCDNKKLAWLFINTPTYNEVDILSTEGVILEEIINRLFPEYDGDGITYEEWGWETPEGDIVYIEEKRKWNKEK